MRLPAWFGAVLLLLPPPSGGQGTVTAIKVEMPMPPDLLAVSQYSCNLLEYEAAESVNAQTGEVTPITHWLVQPYATYLNHVHDKWELPKQALPTNPDEKVAGWIVEVADDHEAIDDCMAWRGEVRKAIARLRGAKRGKP